MIGRVSSAAASVAGVALLAMLAITVGNMLLRAVASPIFGTFELVGLLAVAVNGLALGEAQRQKSNVSIDLVMSRTPMRVQLASGGLVTVVSVVLFSVVGWRLFVYAMNTRASGSRTESLRLEYWPVTLVLATGVVILVLALLADLSAIVRNLRSDEPEGIW